MKDWEYHYQQAERCLQRAMDAMSPEGHDAQIARAQVHAILATIKHIGDGLDQ